MKTTTGRLGEDRDLSWMAERFASLAELGVDLPESIAGCSSKPFAVICSPR